MYILTITIKSSFSSPWFDSDCFEAYKNKERAHKVKKIKLKAMSLKT